MNSKKENIVYILFLLALSTIFILLSSGVSSPVTNRITTDSSIFIAMGKMFLEGKIPYVDFFDHKGPSLILLEAIPQLFIKGRFGIFILQIVNIFLSLYIVSRIANMIKMSKIKLTIVIFFYLAFITRPMLKGNTVEELSFIPLFISLYFLCKYYFVTKKIDPLDGFIIGLCFSFLFWLRANNAGFIVGTTIYIFLATIIIKDYKSLKNLVLYFTIGQLPFSLLYLSYFLYHNAVYELMYATFLFNISYIESFVAINAETYWINILVLVLVVIGSIAEYRKQKDYKIFILTAILYILCLVTINIGYTFPYYYLLYSPLFVLALLLIVDSIDNKRAIKITLIIASILLFYEIGKKGYYHVKEGQYYIEKANKENDKIIDLLGRIPAEERDKVYYYDIFPSFFILKEVTSSYKYCFLQEWHGRHDKQIYEDINSMMKLTPPTYVILNRLGDEEVNKEKFENKKFIEIVIQNYSIYTKDENILIYKLNDSSN